MPKAILKYNCCDQGYGRGIPPILTAGPELSYHTHTIHTIHAIIPYMVLSYILPYYRAPTKDSVPHWQEAR